MSVPRDGVGFCLREYNSGLYLGIKDDARYAGADAVLTAVSEPSPPQWFLKSEQDAYYLVNASAPEMCLNVAYESKSIGDSIQQWSCNGGASELWTLLPRAAGRFALVNKNSGLAIGAADLKSGASITQKASVDDAKAQWNILRQGLEHHRHSAQDLADEMIYNIYAPIYSNDGTLDAINRDLSRIANLGFSTVLLMPIHPMGVATGKHPTVGSPYCVSDFYGVDSALGQHFDSARLVSEAHALGLKVIMDVVLNHTAWSHPFITKRPDFYVHTKGKKRGSDTIAQAFWFNDVAQLDYKSGTAVRDYMTDMLVWWMRNYNVDGYRFDTADNPYGDDRMIPALVWYHIGSILRTINPGVILLGECTNPSLSLRPFNMDYNNYSLQQAVITATKAQDARHLSEVFEELKRSHPAGMLHTSIMQTWDMDLDLRMYGGPDGTLAASIFNFTIEGVPMLFAGEEVGNDCGGLNTHVPINWNGPLADRFNKFYVNMVGLRRDKVTLRRGSTEWLKVTGTGRGLIAFLRAIREEQCLVAINFSAVAVQGHVPGLSNSGWIEVTPTGAAHPIPHSSPPLLCLGPWDFLMFTRSSTVSS